MESKKTGPYLGITGMMSLYDIVRCDSLFRTAVESVDLGLRKKLKFMAGVLVSSKTLAGQTNKYPNRYPRVETLNEVLALKQPHLLRTVHYNTDDASTLREQIGDLFARAGGQIDALQLNIRWASPVAIQRIKRSFPDLRIILQIGAGALSDVTENEDIYVGSALKAYDGVVDDFLIDPSGGYGKEVDVWHALACIMDDHIPRGMRAGIAGGRDADNIREFKGPMRRYGLINIDAEKRMRTENDDLDVFKSSRFIEQSAMLMNEVYLERRAQASAA